MRKLPEETSVIEVGENLRNAKVSMPKATKEKIAKIQRLFEPYSAVVEYIDLIENYFLTEKGTPLLYNSKTGKPKEWVWNPYERFVQEYQEDYLFNGQITGPFIKDENDISRHYPCGSKIEIFNEKILRFFEKNIKQGPILIKVGEKAYFLKEEGRRKGIVVRPLTLKLESKGLVKLL